ncbi:SRPBCC family protein [Ideonella sp. YS5]|uniref:SRPBCC family protein n=1 Tax=Ideonella sp. YS5 TaxID=3453714 RepID=UPI003EEE378C
MAHRRFVFPMPAPEEQVFDAFHHHHWRLRWDSLVRSTTVVGGAPCPYVGAVTENAGAGGLRALSMRTRFVSYDRPRLAAAAMLGRSFPFRRWAASMRHDPDGEGRSLLFYTYTFEAGPPGLRWLFEPVVAWIFDHQTRRRFARLQAFLAAHGADVAQWQASAR